jgi:hypothetical protein
VNDQGIAALVVGFILTQAGFWFDQRRRSGRTDTKVDGVGLQVGDATDAAELAAKRSEPTSNGFASEVRSGLATVIEGQGDIREELEKIRDRLDQHIGDHASSDVRRGSKEAL